MRLANLKSRATIVTGSDEEPSGLDVGVVSQGRFGPSVEAVLEDWDAFREWVSTAPLDRAAPISRAALDAPVTRPRQVFAIGINYAEHAAEAGYPPDSPPVTFTKFPCCLAGTHVEVELPTDTVDWEVEAVAVIGRRATHVSRELAWDHVAGLMVGQDLSERTGQLAGSRPQFSLGKSWPGFGPIGPWIVTPDALPDRDDLAISCSLSGHVMQESRTSRMIYDIPELLVRLSAVCELYPGDLIFTGTPSGIGNARDPKVFIRPGDVLTSCIEGIGTITQHFVGLR